MRWLRRAVWIAAWGVWLWLGMSLHRELPRTHGSPVSTLPFATGEEPLGFLPNSTAFAAIQSADDDSPATITIYDALTGEVVRRIDGPRRNAVFLKSPRGIRNRRDVSRHGLLFANAGPPAGVDDSLEGLHVLDLATGRWRRLSDEYADFTELHPDRLWLLFAERAAVGYPTRRLRVYDLESRRDRFEQLSPLLGAQVYDSFFEPGTDRLVVVLMAVGERYDPAAPKRFAIWKLGEAPILERIVDPASVGVGHGVASPGVAAFGEAWPGRPTMDVVALNDGRRIAQFPGMDVNDGGPQAMAVPPFALSRNGETILGGKPATLWKIASKEMLWRGADSEICYSDPDRNEFAVYEPWPLKVSRSLRFGRRRMEPYATVSWRSFQTGELLHRTWADQSCRPELRGSDGSLGVTSLGEVYRTSPRVDWLLLGFCQILFAAPLVLLWTMLRRRRLRTRIAAPRAV
jgi:hypothetical protein